MALASAAAAAAGGTAAIAYLQARFRVKEDVDRMVFMRHAAKVFAKAVQDDRLSLWYIFASRVAEAPDARCLWTKERTYTRRETHDACARFAQFYLSQGVRPGELVALYLQNSAEFMFAWMGLWSIGCAPACINYNLAEDALTHSIKISGAKLLLVDADVACMTRVQRTSNIIQNDLGVRIVVLDGAGKQRIEQLPAVVPEDSFRKGMKPSFPAALFYTSGTTGLPKAAVFPLSRYWGRGTHLQAPFGCKAGPDGDTWYIPVPLFHASGGMTAYACVACGMTLAIGERFSVSNFWKEVYDSGSTCFLYVGETARYLLNAPPNEYDQKHKLWLMHGNGLRADVWEKFRRRFNVSVIAEFFSSTEGNVFLLNINRGPWSANAVGVDGLITRWKTRNTQIPVAIDYDTGDLLRDPETGFAKRVPYSAGGELIIRLPSQSAWLGYWKNTASTEKKLLRDVFEKGDIFYRTGDALRRTDDGRWFFMDRLGDTYRWKSENVATADVADVLGEYPGVNEVVVYGVTVPKHDGRAGCAAIVLDSRTRSSFDFDDFLQTCLVKLPKYAMPVFLRFIDQVQTTGNNKQNKGPLKAEGIDITQYGSRVAGGKLDPIFWIPPRADKYVSFSEQDLESLNQGRAQL